MQRGAILRAVVGIAISVVAVALVLGTVDVSKTADALSRADLRWVLLGAALSTGDLAFRGLRWQRLIQPIAPVRFLPMFGYLLVGYAANNILPARLGELVRSHYLGDREGLSRAAALGTVVIERVVDLVAVVAIASVALLVLSVRGVLVSAVFIGAAVAGLLLAAVAIGIVAHRLPGVDRIAAYVERWPQVRELGRSLQGGLGVVSRPRTLVETLLATAAAWTCSLLAVAALGQALGVQLSIGQAALMTSGVALAAAIPAAPSNIGTFEAAAVATGTTIGLPAATALAIGLLSHGVILVITSIGGLIAFLRIGWAPTTGADEAKSAP
ncbi:MAG TPA: lysylphosphatidylglycerol synthase transmembrane domain-containing protein [Candidatus Limnocylindrales bacterium]|nr:lysylphosphatidylglycerol synthase transmembrane domain-containing protein [Candidatus Limnocylindrales bacterium]